VNVGVIAGDAMEQGSWVRVRTTFSGLCGSDVKQILLNGSRSNPLTAPDMARLGWLLAGNGSRLER